MNRVELIGRLTKDPDIRYQAGINQNCIARFTLAVDRRYKGEDGEKLTDFISCVAFGKNGEFAEKYLNKGLKIGVCGSIRTGSYEKDGKKVYTTSVAVDEFDFCDGKKANNGGNIGENNSKSGGAAGSDEDGFMEIPDGIDEELPFA